MASGIGTTLQIDLDDTATTPNLVDICAETLDYSINEVDDTYTLLCDNGESRTETISVDREIAATIVYDNDNAAHVYLKDKMDKGLQATNGRKVTSAVYTEPAALGGTVTTFTAANVSQFSQTIDGQGAVRISFVVKPLGTVAIT